MDASMTCEFAGPNSGSVGLNYQQLLDRQASARPGVQACSDSEPRPLCVLVVDDDRDTTDGLSWLVHHWGHTCQRAYSGPAALRVAAEQRLDVVLLDVEMPRMDGYEVARRLRLDSANAGCLIIAVTGWGDEEHRRQCLAAGIDLVLIKPVDASVVETLLRLENERRNRPSEGDREDLIPKVSPPSVLGIDPRLGDHNLPRTTAV
jgi:CheY-like chemotaxis protein